MMEKDSDDGPRLARLDDTQKYRKRNSIAILINRIA
jgi:hypothetical protein